MEKVNSGKKVDVRKLTLTGLFIALIAVMTYVPYTGYISYGGISITTLHIPVIVGAMALGTSGGIILGTTWGLLNLLLAYTSGTPEAMIFMNPLISVVPRVIDGLVIGVLADLLRGKISTNRYAIICGVTGSLVNTILVLSAIGLFAYDDFMAFGDTVAMIFQVLVSVNGVIELGLAIFLTPILINAISKVYPINIKKTKVA